MTRHSLVVVLSLWDNFEGLNVPPSAPRGSSKRQLQVASSTYVLSCFCNCECTDVDVQMCT